jgi:hypothetical protein
MPLFPGLRKGQLLLEYPTGPDGTSHATLAVPLTGTGAAPELGVSPSRLWFPSSLSGSRAQQTITLTNHSTKALSVTGVTVRGGFDVAAPVLPQMLQPREVLVLRVWPRPAWGADEGQVAILSDAPENPQAVRLLSASGWGCLSGSPRGEVLFAFLLCLGYWLAVVAVRWHRVAMPTRGDLRGELDAVEAELDALAPADAADRKPVFELLTKAGALLSGSSKLLDILFWSRGQEINGWGYAHEAQIRMVKLMPDSILRARLEVVETSLRLANEPCATALADSIHALLAGAKPEEKPDTERMKALLVEGFAMSYGNQDGLFASLVGWQNKASWLVLCGLSSIVALTAIFPRQAALLVVGAAGGLISRLSRSLDQKDVPTDYGASWTTLFLSPVAGAVGAWAGIMIAALAVKANVLGPLFQVDWEKPEGVGTLAIALLFGFSERLLDSVLDKLNGAAESGKGTAPGAATLMIDDLKLQDGKVNNVYPEQRLQASGATGTVQWTVTQGGLPPGLSLGSDGRITGTPMKEGTFSFTVEAADSKTKAPRSLTIKINA